MKDFTIDGVTVRARNYQTAVRRIRGYKRGELDIEGRTILARKRTPPGSPMRRRKETS